MLAPAGGLQLRRPAVSCGRASVTHAILSSPFLHGSHGHRSSLRAIFYAAGPSFRQGTRFGSVRAIDIAPTMLRILGVVPPRTAEGAIIESALLRRQ